MHPRLAPAAALAVALAACTDVRDFRGTWSGARAGADAVRVGAPAAATATLEITEVDKHGLAADLAIPGLVDGEAITSLSAAEADALSTITFDGAPLRVYLAFAPTSDGGGDALAVIALYDGRVELRLLRGDPAPIYAVYSMSSGSSGATP